ncbi:MAG: PAP2 family protein [Fidelibacterota bacterium]|nr:MAG: PAP2 family protein [Candidatus Neomarinimicrobiota bacterium]
MTGRAALIISYVFNPMTNPALVFPILLGANQNLAAGKSALILAAAVFFASIVPTWHVIRLKHKGRIATIDVDDKSKRIRPLAVGVISYLIGYLLLARMQAPSLVTGLMFCYVTNTVLVLFMTRWWKVSIHATGVSGPLVALSYQFGYIIAPFYILIPIVGAARVVLGKHTIAQVIIGVLVGTGMTALQLKYLFL